MVPQKDLLLGVAGVFAPLFLCGVFIVSEQAAAMPKSHKATWPARSTSTCAERRGSGRMASNSKKKPPTTSSDGHESRRRREGAAAPRDAEIALLLRELLFFLVSFRLFVGLRHARVRRDA